MAALTRLSLLFEPKLLVSTSLMPAASTTARTALEAGAPILCDARMVSEGITRPRLPARNEVICTLHQTGVPELALRMGNTRSAAAVELWRPHLAGAVVAIGNAPTALFHLLNMLEDSSCPRPAAIVGCRSEPSDLDLHDGRGDFGGQLLERVAELSQHPGWHA